LGGFEGVAVATALGLVVIVGAFSLVKYWLRMLLKYWGLTYKTDLVILGVAGASLAFE
jgi:hypothetical protein